jgi:hypothetical protein
MMLYKKNHTYEVSGLDNILVKALVLVSILVLIF